MPPSSFIDEINRLFDELVRERWQRPTQSSAELVRSSHGTTLDVEIPIAGTERDDLSVTAEGRRLTVSVRRRASESESGEGGDVTASSEEHFRQSFTVPEGTDLSGIEAHFEHGVLRLRIGLRQRARLAR